MIDLADLESKARAATQGEWELHGYSCMVAGSVDTLSGPVLGTILRAEPCNETDGDGRTWTCSGSQEANAAYIAAAQPRVVLELIERIRAAEGKAGEPVAWQSKLTGAVTTTPSAYDFWREDIGAENITPLYAAPVDTAALAERVKTLEEALREIRATSSAEHMSGSHITPSMRIEMAFAQIEIMKKRARKALGGSNE